MFDGDDGIKIVSPFVSGDEDFTIAIWMSPTLVGTASWHGFVGYQAAAGARAPSLWVNWDGGDDVYTPHSKDDGLLYDVRTTQNGDGIRFSGVINDFFELNTYVHVVWTAKSGEFYKFYKNGADALCQDNRQQNCAAASNFDVLDHYWIGRQDNYFSGTIDEVAFFKHALSADDVSAIYGEHDRTGGSTTPLSLGSSPGQFCHC
jgi:hypothetical protein